MANGDDSWKKVGALVAAGGLLLTIGVHSIRVAVIVSSIQADVRVLSGQQERRIELLEDALAKLQQTGTDGANRRLDMMERRMDRAEGKLFNGGAGR